HSSYLTYTLSLLDALPISGWRNADLLSRVDQVRILDHFAVGLEDLWILGGVLVEVQGDRRQRIARFDDVVLDAGGFAWLLHRIRSEEHTSELQSRSELVCR